MDEKYKLLGNFEKFWKILDKNSIENLNFMIIFGNFVPKNRAFGNNTIFLQQSFRLRGGGGPPPQIRQCAGDGVLYERKFQF